MEFFRQEFTHESLINCLPQRSSSLLHLVSLEQGKGFAAHGLHMAWESLSLPMEWFVEAKKKSFPIALCNLYAVASYAI